MEKVRYMISDAAAMVCVETHVLRYWEEELDLTIPRNEMGHRYYTRENIEEFKRIKELKEQGHQLKAIKMLLHGENAIGQSAIYPLQSGRNLDMVENSHSGGVVSAEERMEQFKELMCEVVGHAIALNNDEITQQIGLEVQERILKEMNYLMREQESAQEERYKKLDSAIRGNVRKQGRFFSKKEKVSTAKVMDKKNKGKVKGEESKLQMGKTTEQLLHA